jgi:hypothetical protein
MGDHPIRQLFTSTEGIWFHGFWEFGTEALGSLSPISLRYGARENHFG